MSDEADRANPEAAPPTTLQEQFLVVGVGASAGGIDALRAFFRDAPPAAAYVVVLHRSPGHDSGLAGILRNVTSMPVLQVDADTAMEPAHVYLAPPQQSLTLSNGHLVTADIRSVEGRRSPIDTFFRSLGERLGARAVAVVLSGTGSDGAAGLKHVKEHGGLAFAQDPAEAVHGEMPRHAIATDLIDAVLPAGAIAGKIASYHRYRMRAPEVQVEVTPGERALAEILSHLRTRTGHDFTSYKRSTLLRRVQRRVAVHELPGLAEYAQVLRREPDEARALLKDLLISVTRFFRDPAAYAALEGTVIPELLRTQPGRDHARVWVAGCATGEEVYSIAMLLCEQASPALAGSSVQIFATDIDERALARARSGFYTAGEVEDVSEERLARFFVAERDGYRVRTELREMVLFATHNLIRHPPYSHLDLVSCRNLLIYLDRAAQQRVIELFHFALRPGGFLFLGTSESLDGAAELFEPLDKEARIFRRREGERRAALAYASLHASPLPVLHERATAPAQREDTHERLSRQSLHLRLLELHAPPSVVIDEDDRILHVSDTAGRYMRIGGGEPSDAILDLVRPELSLDLRSALHDARRQKAQVHTRSIALRIGGAEEHVSLTVRPVADADYFGRSLVLVLFEDASRQPHPANAEPSASRPGGGARQLEDELARVRAQLLTTIEQHDLQSEELKAANEELQSMNEELRSTSEELETGKEELQSSNEELSTVNQEFKVKIDELTQAHNDARNLMNAIDTAIIFLDRVLRVKRYTPTAKALFNFIPEDVGRSISDITHRLRQVDLTSDIRRVLETLQSLEREVQTEDGTWLIERIAPYRTESDRIEGVVLTFVDITVRKRAELAIEHTEEQFRRALEEAPIPTIMQTEQGEVLQLSRAWTALTGYSLSDLPTLDSWLSRAYGHGADEVRAHVRSMFKGERNRQDVPFEIVTRSGEVRHWSFSTSAPGTLRDGRRFIIGIAVDDTERQRAADALASSEGRLRLMLESVTDYAIFTFGPRGVIETWNVGAQNVFGYTAEEAVGLDCAVLFTPEDRANDACADEMRRAREQGSASDERWHVRKDGERFFASGKLTPIYEGTRLIGYCKVARDRTRQRMADEALAKAHAELEARVAERTRELAEKNEALQQEIEKKRESEELRIRLLGELVDAQESERRRISRELHDQLGQQLTAIGLKLASLREMRHLPPAADAELEVLQEVAKQLDSDIDFLVWELRPTALDDLGLREALSDYVNAWARHFGIAAELHVAGLGNDRLAGDVETVLYRIAQEALNNVAKHAHANQVDMILEQRADHVALIVEDDGVGFDTGRVGEAGRGAGLVGMRERAAFAGGTVTIESSPGTGTTVFVRIPTT